MSMVLRYVDQLRRSHIYYMRMTLSLLRKQIQKMQKLWLNAWNFMDCGLVNQQI